MIIGRRGWWRSAAKNTMHRYQVDCANMKYTSVSHCDTSWNNTRSLFHHNISTLSLSLGPPRYTRYKCTLECSPMDALDDGSTHYKSFPTHEAHIIWYFVFCNEKLEVDCIDISYIYALSANVISFIKNEWLPQNLECLPTCIRNNRIICYQTTL